MAGGSGKDPVKSKVKAAHPHKLLRSTFLPFISIVKEMKTEAINVIPLRHSGFLIKEVYFPVFCFDGTALGIGEGHFCCCHQLSL